ncbi:MAG TPA: hypothetical protein VGZ89_12100 [Xanthobacteraceae bacterium]|jgi:hypothetical protein|nr:hypothetical protein [Xanthobacteraceae bacterium]
MTETSLVLVVRPLIAAAFSGLIAAAASMRDLRFTCPAAYPMWRVSF